MQNRDYQDLIGGVLLIALGVFVAVIAQERYAMGALNRIGPGAYPLGLGVLLAALGLFIAVPAWRRTGTFPQVEWRTAGLVLLGILLFALLLNRAGLVVASLVTVVVASLADRESTWPFRIVLAVCVTVLTVLIFKVGLGMLLPLWWWN